MSPETAHFLVSVCTCFNILCTPSVVVTFLVGCGLYGSDFFKPPHNRKLASQLFLLAALAAAFLTPLIAIAALWLGLKYADSSAAVVWFNGIVLVLWTAYAIYGVIDHRIDKKRMAAVLEESTEQNLRRNRYE